MADEVQIRTSLQVIDDPQVYRGQPSQFTGDIVAAKPLGPCPGAFTVATAPGTDLDLSQLTTPAYFRFQNLDPKGGNFVTYGIWDPEGGVFYPIHELLGGESYVGRISRDLAWEFGTGTGTTGAETNTLRFVADTASLVVLAEVWEA